MKRKMLIEYHRSNCECDDASAVDCPACQTVKILEDVIPIKQANERLKTTHDRHLSALQFYYHKVHKECPCQDEDDPGKCMSPWKD